jgi:IS5 family transposase
VHTAGVATGKVHDAKVMHRLVREDDTAVYGDKGYASDAKKRGSGDRWRALGRERESKARPRTHEASARAEPPLRPSACEGRASSAYSNANSGSHFVRQ